MLAKTKSELERNQNNTKQHQKVADSLEYQSEEDQKKLERAITNTDKEKDERLRLEGEAEQVKRDCEAISKLKIDKREKMKELQKDQQRLTTVVRDKMEQRSKLERARDQHIAEVKKIDQRVEKVKVELDQCDKVLTRLIQDNPWVRNERHMF